MREKRRLNWRLSWSDCAETPGTVWYSASVPGIVQTDMQKALGIPDYRYGDHEAEYEWMENKYWHYTADLDLMDLSDDSIVALCFESVDYACEVRLNGHVLLRHEGMFSPFEINVTPYKGRKCELVVVIFPAPKRPGYSRHRGLGGEASSSCKPAFSYGWDWCPRFVTLGICGEAYLEIRPAAYLKEMLVSYVLADDFSRADITVDYQASMKGILTCRLLLPDGYCAIEKSWSSLPAGSVRLELESPPLWYPAGHGDQPVCTLELTLRSGGLIDTLCRPIGFRRSQLLPNEGSESGVEGSMITCNKAPMTACLNGKKIFLKGSNWVPPEMSPAQLSNERLRSLLTLVKNAGMNVLRVWGGGYLLPEIFYDICDEYGILVWQEFPLACACYCEEEEYLSILEQEARTMLRLLRVHPCLLLWSGGNELFNSWSGMTLQSHPLRLLDKLCYEEDRMTPFIMTSPQYGVAHGSYDILYHDGREHLTVLCEEDFIAYTEFGVGAPSTPEYLKTFLTDSELHNPYPGTIWEKRHAFGSSGRTNRWFDREAILTVTGCEDEPLTLFCAGDEVQGRMYAAMFEECRRKWPYTSMALNWCFNEPWPTAAGNGLIHYPDLPRSSYAKVCSALKNPKLSLRFTKLCWNAEEPVVVECWVLNDQYQTYSGGTAVIRLRCGNTDLELARWNFTEIQENMNLRGPIVSFHLPKNEAKEFEISISSPEYPEWNDVYHLYIRKEYGN